MHLFSSKSNIVAEIGIYSLNFIKFTIFQSGECVIRVGEHNIYWTIAALHDMNARYFQRIQWHQIDALATTLEKIFSILQFKLNLFIVH